MSSDQEPFEKPIEAAAKGATKGLLEWTAERLDEFIRKFIDKDIAFIEDTETVDIAKEQRTKTEWAFFAEYVEDKDLRVLFQMGLTLRALERQNMVEKLEKLRKKIVNKYDTEGLHFAQVIQNGIFGKYLGSVLERTPTPQNLKVEINNLFKNIDKTIAFIQPNDDIDKKTNEIVAKILANSPKTFIISSAGTATNTCEEIKKKTIEKFRIIRVNAIKRKMKAKVKIN